MSQHNEQHNVVRWFKSADQDSEVLLSDVTPSASCENIEDMDDQEKENESMESSRLTANNNISGESGLWVLA